jgi:hypothetical protein
MPDPFAIYEIPILPPTPEVTCDSCNVVPSTQICIGDQCASAFEVVVVGMLLILIILEIYEMRT